jgi:hypothetical protein
MGIHAACVAVACIVTPLVMGSNLWPIAAAFWVVITVPAGLLTGAAIGWAVRKRSAVVLWTVLVATGVALAIAVGMIISRNG